MDFCPGNKLPQFSTQITKEGKKTQKTKNQQQNKNNFISLLEVEAFNYWGKLQADLQISADMWNVTILLTDVYKTIFI